MVLSPLSTRHLSLQNETFDCRHICNEMLESVFSYLSIFDLSVAARTCVRFQQLTANIKLRKWEKIKVLVGNYSANKIFEICLNHPGLPVALKQEAALLASLQPDFVAEKLTSFTDEGGNESHPVSYLQFLSQKVAYLMLLKVIVWRGGSINRGDAMGFSALHHAVIFNNSDACAVLLKAGACREMIAFNGQTPLMIAQEQGHKNLCAMLADSHG